MFYTSTNADTGKIASLYSYTGYLTTPNTYIKDGEVSFFYSFINSSAAINTSSTKSDNWIFSTSMGFLPFLECYFSLYVEPQNNISEYTPNFGANKFRSLGVKMKIIDETKRVPSLAIGIFDPNLKKIGAKYSANSVSSTFVVFTKQYGFNKSSISLGYGSDILSGRFSRLNGIFGGINLCLNNNVSILLDYDAKYWSQGIGLQWRDIDVEYVLINSNALAFRIGYNINLYKK
ncbi:YjbH domain-containing protein [Candidatus Latescibacterota bacterium]